METIKRAAAQALEHARNQRRGGSRRWALPSPEDIKTLRKDLGLTQLEFCNRFGFDLDSVKSWETRRRFPDRASCFIFALIKHDPHLTERLMEAIENNQDLEKLEPKKYIVQNKNNAAISNQKTFC